MTRRHRQRALAAVLVVGLVQAVVIGARGQRDPSPFRTFHTFDVTLARTVKVMRGEAWARSLPVGELIPPTWYGMGPPQMWAVVPGNAPDAAKMYKRQQPLFFLLAGALPAATGLGPLSLRLGPLALLWGLAGLLAWTAHRLAGPRALVAAGVLMLLVPAGWQTAMMALPGLGMMLGAALVTAGIVASDRLRSPVGAALVGLAVAVAAWMGESAGDTVQVLAVTLPTVVLGGLWGAVSKGSALQRLRAVVGAGLALGVARVLIDVPWILRHTQGYLLSEATGGGRPPDPFAFLHTVPTALLGNLVDGYLETLAWSLLTPAGAAVVALGLVAGLFTRHRLAMVWALGGPAALLVLLSMPEKTGDYYALVAVPGIVLAAAVGLSSLRRWGLVVLAAGSVATSVVLGTVAHLDLPPVKAAICQPSGGLWLLQDPLACASRDPHPRIRPTMRIARKIPGSVETRRTAVAQWLAGIEMVKVWPQIPPGSVIWIIGGNQSPVDTAEVSVLTQRADLLPRTLQGQAHNWRARPDLQGTEEWVFLLGDVRSGSTVPPKWPAYIGDLQDFGGTGDIRVGRLTPR